MTDDSPPPQSSRDGSHDTSNSTSTDEWDDTERTKNDRLEKNTKKAAVVRGPPTPRERTRAGTAGRTDESMVSLDSSSSVESRWWYWVAALPLYVLIAIPISIVLFLVAFVPLFVGAGPGMGDPAVIAPVFGLWLVVMIGLFVGFALLGLVLMFVFPIALYLDAKAVSESAIGWDPDPVLYAILGALHFFVSPIVGLIVGLYYLYRRHEHVGVP